MMFLCYCTVMLDTYMNWTCFSVLVPGLVCGRKDRCQVLLKVCAAGRCKKRSHHCAVRRSFRSPSSGEYSREDSSTGRFEDRL